MSGKTSRLYKGRFAPSPTGPVHFGTLIAAVGSYLQAKTKNGEWLVRMEDVDITRKVDGSDTDILNTLEAFGLQWDGAIIYQSDQTEQYENVLQRLLSQSCVFPCTCSRKQLSKTDNAIYPGNCRNRKLPETNEHALRLIADITTVAFADIVMGKQKQNIAQQCGDFIIKRHDGLFAYQLAVVVDDAIQGITEIVRGCDLLDSTPRQIYLQQLVGYSTPEYCHLPLAVDVAGNKISKSEGAAKIDINHKEKLLCDVLQFLGQNPPADLADSGIEAIWKWALDNWDVALVPAANNRQLQS